MDIYKRVMGVTIGFILFSQIACGGNRVYSGRVIDADTGEPIEGAVVVAIWDKERATIAGPSSRHHDVKEAVTDGEGRWTLEGPEGDEGRILPTLLHYVMIPRIRRPYFIVFKPGYCPWPEGFAINTCKSKLSPKGNAEIINGSPIHLVKLSNREERLRVLPGPVYPDDVGRTREFLIKQKRFLFLINQERKYLDLEEYPAAEE